MAYESISLKKDIDIKQIYTIHYFEYMSNFHFPGERHDFWEFQYVDKGQTEVRADNISHILGRGQVIFHRPNEFHTLKAAGKTAPNIIVVSFACHSPCMKFFEKKILSFTEKERELLGMLVAEASHCISTPLNDPYTEKMVTAPESLFGSQQLIINYLELLLIQVLRRYTITTFSLPAGRPQGFRQHSAMYHTVILYLEEHIRQNVSIDQICHDNLIGRSQLQKLFREQHHCGVIEFFSTMKIELAKQLIREQQLNFTQISDFLGYSTIHYFSRQFKKISGMTPTEYAMSVKAMSERKV